MKMFRDITHNILLEPHRHPRGFSIKGLRITGNVEAWFYCPKDAISQQDTKQIFLFFYFSR
jgi:hypothetical protein